MGSRCVGGTCLSRFPFTRTERLRAHSWRFGTVQCRRSSCDISARIRAIFIEHELSNRRGHEVSHLHREKVDSSPVYTRLIIDKDTRSDGSSQLHASLGYTIALINSSLKILKQMGFTSTRNYCDNFKSGFLCSIFWSFLPLLYGTITYCTKRIDYKLIKIDILKFCI